MNKLEFTNKVIDNLNDSIHEDGKVGLAKFIGLTNKLYEAINYTHCCTELKEKKAIPFDDWTRVKGMKLLIDSNYRWDKTHVYKEVVHKMYEVYLINL